MPVLDPLLTQFPAQLDELAIAIRGEVDQTLERTLQLDAHAVEAGDSFQQLELGAACRIAGLLVAIAIVSACSRSFGLILGDPRLVLELWEQSRKLRDLRDDSAHARQLLVCLVDRIGAEPLHGSTIVRMPPQTSTLHRMESSVARKRLAESKIARLATVGEGGRPHIVPLVFAIEEDIVYFAVDAKPKTTRNLKRLQNIAANPAVAVLADHYEDDWNKLWWVRADGTARVVTDAVETKRAIDLLVDRYEQYRYARPAGPVVAIHIDRLSGWSGA